ncbi:hypothetical protein BCR37DRAFT_255847 [Protomyces lactucae-debilis]|uniref:Uncharacterized protein n=1 Tax=Protomyces lactucae-debilis TaxID=2754530 RepID=A0A1Y2FQL5_PROLT|nr:uncharacterized protein BCR37DRAFT_255847 [Protomyces lactucae-debilis]ORY84985.1 hypothetical protein BCR37DRAFT_255847 [Protomyces lactucae-debilis]
MIKVSTRPRRVSADGCKFTGIQAVESIRKALSSQGRQYVILNASSCRLPGRKRAGFPWPSFSTVPRRYKSPYVMTPNNLLNGSLLTTAVVAHEASDRGSAGDRRRERHAGTTSTTQRTKRCAKLLPSLSISTLTSRSSSRQTPLTQQQATIYDKSPPMARYTWLLFQSHLCSYGNQLPD